MSTTDSARYAIMVHGEHLEAMKRLFQTRSDIRRLEGDISNLRLDEIETQAEVARLRDVLNSLEERA